MPLQGSEPHTVFQQPQDVGRHYHSGCRRPTWVAPEWVWQARNTPAGHTLTQSLSPCFSLFLPLSLFSLLLPHSCLLRPLQEDTPACATTHHLQATDLRHSPEQH